MVFNNFVNCFIYPFDSLDTNQNLILNSNDYKIIPLSNETVMPNVFIFELNIENYNVKIQFNFIERVYSPTNNVTDCYLYREIKTGCIATLMFMEDLNLYAIDSDYPFLFIISGKQNNTSIIVTPRIFENKVKYILMNDNNNTQYDFLFNDALDAVKKSKIKRSSVSNGPQILNLKYLLVIDSTVYQKLKNLIETENNAVLEDLIIESFIKLIYSHFVNDIDSKFYYSLLYDQDLRIRVNLVDINIKKSSLDSPWSSSDLVSVPEMPIWNNYSTILAEESLKIFSDTMNNMHFPYEYDYAVAIINKDIWSNNKDLNYIDRSLLNGYTYPSGICGPNRYSIIEDSGLFSIYTATRHLAINLGADYDGTGFASTCPPSSNYIMTPVIGIYTDNVRNLNRFSPCSIEAFKNLLTNPDGSLSKNSQCLTVIPDKIDLNFYRLDSDGQCRLIYGYASKSCSDKTYEICQTLYCDLSYGWGTDLNCVGRPGFGATDGTACGIDKFCYDGQCIQFLPKRCSNS